VLTVLARQACLGAERSAMLWSIWAVPVGLAMRPDYVNTLLSRVCPWAGSSDLKPGSDQRGFDVAIQRACPTCSLVEGSGA
jgi:hypothetical protein